MRFTTFAAVAVIALLALAAARPARASPCDVSTLVSSMASSLITVSTSCSTIALLGCSSCATAVNNFAQNSCFALFCPPGSACRTTLSAFSSLCSSISFPSIPSFISQCQYTTFVAATATLASDCSSQISTGGTTCSSACQNAINAVTNSPCMALLCPPGSTCSNNLDLVRSHAGCFSLPGLAGLNGTTLFGYATQSIGAAGGALSFAFNRTANSAFSGLTGNFSLGIPTNALNSAYGNISLGMSQLATTDFTPPTGFGAFMSTPIALTPHGTQFSAGVTISIPFDTNVTVASGKVRCILRSESSSGALTAIANCGNANFNTVTGTATLTVTSFSSYAAATVDSSSVPSAAAATQPLSFAVAALLALVSLALARFL